MWILLLTLFSALAGDALSLSVTRVIGEGTSPVLTLTAAFDGTVDIAGTCGSLRFGGQRQMAAGDTWNFELGLLPKGNHSCSAGISFKTPQGETGSMSVPFTVEARPALSLSAEAGDIDLEGRMITLTANRPVTKVEVVVYGPGNARVGEAQVGMPATTRPSVEWFQAPGSEAVKLEVSAWDDAGFGGKLELIPWSYRIPHEDVIFDTAQHTILPGEEPKLEKAWGDLQEVLAKYGSVVEVQLFVAGYTDTVGDAASNQGLSERRARAIAEWFRARGFAQAIWYQGFGESALAVQTPDSTDMAANRRALYILAAQPPRPSSDLPRSSWTSLR